MNRLPVKTLWAASRGILTRSPSDSAVVAMDPTGVGNIVVGVVIITVNLFSFSKVEKDCLI